jgi:hypothetical protein
VAISCYSAIGTALKQKYLETTGREMIVQHLIISPNIANHPFDLFAQSVAAFLLYEMYNLLLIEHG